MSGWRTALLLMHRWLGIAGCLLFAAWFVSGIAMMYVRMPAVAVEEQLARAEPLDVTAATLSPVDAANRAGLRFAQVQVRMLQGRPAYRFGQTLVFADTGEVFGGLDVAGAEAAARRWAPPGAAVRYDAYLTEPDQWTMETRLPVYRFTVDDGAGTWLYVSEETGEVVQRATRRERLLAYAGPVMHWLYFTPLRRNGPVWADVVIWASLVGCVLCASGLVWGLLRLSPRRRFRPAGAPAVSPYTGLLKWHHYTGLAVGLAAFTWVYSGLLSMEPFGWFATPGLTAEQRAAATGGPLRTDLLTLDSLRAAMAAYGDGFVPRRLDVVQVRGEPFWAADRAPDDAGPWQEAGLRPRASRPRLARAYVPAAQPERGVQDGFTHETIEAVARDVMADVPMEDAAWLDAYDGYYYDPGGTRGLPVLRVRYADAPRTWLYLDPARGGVVQLSQRAGRVRRWLYQGLHSLDFPFLYFRRPLWDAVVIALSIGGAALSVTTILPAWRRLRRHAAAGARRLRPGGEA